MVVAANRILLRGANRYRLPAAKGAGKAVTLDDLDDDDDDDGYAAAMKSRAQKKRSPIFSWFNDVSKPEHPEHGDNEWQLEDGHDTESFGSKPGHPAAWQDEDDEDGDQVAWRSPVLEDGGDAGMLPAHEQPVNTPAMIDRQVEEEAQEQPFDPAESFDDTDEPDEFEEPSPAQPLRSPAIASPDEEEGLDAPGSIIKPPTEKPYLLPSLALLQKPSGSGKPGDTADSIESRRKLEATLESFGVRAKVLDVVRGPAVTRYEVQPARA